jgi:hypothetical protein
LARYCTPRTLSPSLDRRDFADLAGRLDRAPEVAFTYPGLRRPEQVARVRDQFAAWLRDTRQIETGADRPQRERAAPGRGLPEALRSEPPDQGTPDSHMTSPAASRTAKNLPGPDRAGTPGPPRRTASPPGAAAGNAKQTVTAQNSNDDHQMTTISQSKRPANV